MNTTQVLDNIRADFVKEIKPLVFNVSLKSITASDFQNLLHSVMVFTSKSTYKACFSIFARNGYECVFYNLFKTELDFPRRLSYRFLSATLATLSANIIFDEERGFIPCVLSPLWHGTIYGIEYMFINKEESKLFLNNHFSRQIKAVQNSPKMMSIVNFVQKIYSLLNDPQQAYATIANQQQQQQVQGLPQLQYQINNTNNKEGDGNEQGQIHADNLVQILGQQLIAQFGPEVISQLADTLTSQLEQQIPQSN